MQTIESEVQLNEGSIQLPLAYRHLNIKQKVKFIVFSHYLQDLDLTGLAKIACT